VWGLVLVFLVREIILKAMKRPDSAESGLLVVFRSKSNICEDTAIWAGVSGSLLRYRQQERAPWGSVRASQREGRALM
jgi:hypothetical protein